MGPKTEQLLKLLDDLAATLDGYGERHWSRWIAEDATRLRNGDLTAISHFLDAFGGMGSVNDLFICPENGHRILESQVSTANAALSEALNEAWTLARMLSGKSA